MENTDATNKDFIIFDAILFFFGSGANPALVNRFTSSVTSVPLSVDDSEYDNSRVPRITVVLLLFHDFNLLMVVWSAIPV